jgi:ribosomal protein L12E/L44/L45/RPP1/RPP2
LDVEIFKMSDAEVKFANLQFRYTELLEKRIAQLEAALASPVAITKPADATDDADKKKDDEKKDDDDESSDDEKEKKEKKDVCYDNHPNLNPGETIHS